MKRFAFVFLLVCSSWLAFSQELIRSHIQNTAVSISSDELTGDDKDFVAIGKAIGDARVVMLGEQDHGDAATFQIKSRLVKYLYDKLGFDVLIFESDFYGVTEGWNRANQGLLPFDQLIAENIFHVWTDCPQNRPLFELAKRSLTSKRPLILAGIDPTRSFGYSRKAIQDIEPDLNSFNIPFVSTKSYGTQLLPVLQALVENPYPAEVDKSNYPLAILQLDTLLQGLKIKGKANTMTYMVLSNLQSSMEVMLRNDYFGKMQIRDSMMAENLSWLSDVKFAGKKIIVWAASYHIAKCEGDKIRHRNMGSRFVSTANRERQSYVIGFTSHEGETKNWDGRSYKFSSPEKESVEGWLFQKGYSAAFFDFKSFRRKYTNVNDTFYMAGIRHLQQLDNWPLFYDGIIYLRSMYPCSESK